MAELILKPDGDTLLFDEKDGKVYIRKVKNFLDLEGTLPSLKLLIEKLREKAMEEMAKEPPVYKGIKGKEYL